MDLIFIPDEFDSVNNSNRSSAYSRGRDLSSRIGEVCDNDTDISFVSSGRPSTDRMPAYDSMDSGRTPRMSTSSDQSGRSSFRYGGRDSDISSLNDLSSQSSFESERTSISSSYSTNTTVNEAIDLAPTQSINVLIDCSGLLVRA